MISFVNDDRYEHILIFLTEGWILPLEKIRRFIKFVSPYFLFRLLLYEFLDRRDAFYHLIFELYVWAKVKSEIPADLDWTSNILVVFDSSMLY